MSLEESIKETCSNLTSIRATERKKSAEKLKDFLTRNAVPSLLTANTLKRSGYTWNHVFDEINDYIMKETEKFETAKNFQTVTVPLCTSLLHLCVSGANKGHAYIKCEKITEACLNILNNSRLTRAVGDAYLNLLYKHIFTNDYYPGYISPATWESLLDVCLMACNTNNSQLDNLIKIRLLLFVIKTATRCCQFAHTLRDALSKVKKCCLTMFSDKKVQEFVLEIVILLLEKLALESRVTMCEFSEMILPKIFKCYEHSMEQKKKSLFFKLLQTAILIHHPLGKTQNVNGSLAYNWSVWNKHLFSIMEIICLEVNFIQKTRKNNDSSFIHCNYFYYTAASVFYQIFNTAEEDKEEEAGNSAKKIKLSFNKNKSFTDLVEELRLNNAPWIGIILMYVKHFDYAISSDEYIQLLSTLESIVSGNRDLNWECFEGLTCLVIKNLISSPEYKQQDNYEVYLTLWNTCIRNATVANAAHTVMHKIIQVILSLVPLKHQHVQPLLMLYLEKGMPVNDYTLKTLNICFHKFYRKCCNLDVRKKCFTWLTYEDIATLDSGILKEFLIRLICNENLPVKQICDNETEFDIYDCIFMNIEKGILYSEFEYDVTKSPEVTVTDAKENFEINYEVYNMILVYLEQVLSKIIQKLINGDVKCMEFVKHVNLMIAFTDSLLNHNLKTISEIENMSLYSIFKNALIHMYAALAQTLKSEAQIRDKVMLLKYVQDILQKDYNPLINKEIRKHIEEECFHIINDVVKKDIASEDGDSYYECDVEYSAIGLKQNCVYLLATYCRKQSTYTDDIAKFILDRDLYNFTSNFEIDCALRCIQILNDVTVERRPLDLIFSLMQDMCKDLFRNPKATRGLLRTLDCMLEQIWSHNDDMIRQNCLIMIKGYLHRCMKMPPDVAAIVYKCVAKILNFNNNINVDLQNSFKQALNEKIIGNNHCIRLYCCHLLTLTAGKIHDQDIQSLADNLMDIFVINISDNNDSVLNDESLNRTITVLRCFYVLATTNKSYVHDIIIKILLFQNEKVMDKNMVKKMLNLLTQKVTSSEIDVYMNVNILRVLHCWCKRNKRFDTLPLYLFGLDKFDDFIVKHVKWLVSTDILWQHNGVVGNSDVFEQLKIRSKKTDEDMIEMCFCNIILLCLPHIVIDKYKLVNEKHFSIKTTEHANIMFHSTRHILKNERWSNLFVENLGELLLLIVMHISDHDGAAELFQVHFVCKPDTYTYSKRVFSAILKFFGELIDGNIMQYLCENQPLVILNILFKLWDNVLREKVFDFKVLIFHAYLSFVDHIPLGYTSDAILCNFLCTSVAHAIKDSHSEDEVKIFVKGLKIIIVKMLTRTPINVENIQRSTLSKIVSILNIKFYKGYTECKSLLDYITTDLKDTLTESVDIVDYINLMSDGVEVATKTSKRMFLNELETYTLSLSNASQSSLYKMSQFLKRNKRFIKDLYTDLNVKGFSEDCETSLLHKIIYALTNVLKSETDEKIIVEACNCLAEVGAYDMKTLVTVPPADTTRVRDLNPKQYIAILVLRSLSEQLFDEDPTVSNKVTKALNRLLKFRDGKAALDMVTIDTAILKSLVSTDCEVHAEYKIDNNKFDKYNAIEYWIPLKDERHTQWITRITLALLDTIASSTNYINSLSAVCAVKPEVCRKVMPAIFGLILYCSTEIHANVYTEQLNQVFKYIWDLSYDANVDSSTAGSVHKKSTKLDNDLKIIVHYLLDVVNFVRIQRNQYKKSGRARGAGAAPGLQLDCVRAAAAAARAGRHWAALYYGELGAAGELDLVRRIFRECYVSIGEMDAIDGCGIGHLTSDQEKRKHLMNTGQFSDALVLHDIALSRSRTRHLAHGAVTALHRSGMHHLALQYIQSYPEDDTLDDIKYDCLSYLGDWSDFVDTAELEEKSKEGNCIQDSIIKAMRYSCLKDCLNLQTTAEVSNKLQLPLNRAKLAVARLCQSLNMENCQNVYKIVANLHLFRDIETYFSVRCDKKLVSELVDEWKVDNIPIFNDFKHLEAIISQRSLILEHIAQADSINFSNINELQLQYAELGLSNNRIQMAQRLVATVKNLEESKRVVLLESQISWAKGHTDIALSLLHSIVAQESDDLKLSAMSLRQYGLWMAESKRDTGRDIIHKYLEESLKTLSGNDDVDTRLKVYYDIAKFADAEYKQVVSYMNSSVFENKIKCIESMKGNAASLKFSQQTLARKNESTEEKAVIRAKYRVNNVFGELDEAEIANTKAEKESFLQLAMRYYLLALKQCDDNNLSVFRVISLWLDNPGINFDDEEHGSFGRLLHAIPSWKFISVLPQLAPRISNENSVFAEHLRQIMKRCAIDHPHHTLPLLFSLKNSDKDVCGEAGEAGEAREAREAGEAGEAREAGEAGEARARAAGALVRQLAGLRPLARVVAQTDDLCDAMISFAYCVPVSKDLKPQAVPKMEAISKLRDLNAIPIPTDTIPIRKDCDYSRLNSIISFENVFELVGGINYPKKISCLSSDGKKRILLIKGKDDLRQDAVMQQVFNIVNTLLEKSPVTKRNKLLIRTYKVVPMSKRSGVLQWCEGTIPMGAYLVNAHIKYRPQDITPSAARTKLKDCQEQRKSNKYKLHVFKEILKEFKPVFHNFFTEYYLDPVTWYERRLAYTRSVATSSMVGYIMGLGDRHVQNILIDTTTAELIHIDFGIAFDQGRTLPTPETVPFRLTQDIVAGFGSSGVEGIFRRCCEKTLQLLRDNQETLLTILEVLLCDPLYLWIIPSTPDAKSTPPSGAGLAARALLAVSCKLCGAEGGAAGGAPGGVSVAGHVARLLRCAADPANLCQLFHGWQPYL
ncbi:serine-protein kinase ATM [Nymphalis io]|uniref:serine-protein kinase ATM n=1 Tax=Inachis io TaxID=171585 RepID=UPI002169CDA1|nr:serine-protein kinase ATM [Nymphalis io]